MNFPIIGCVLLCAMYARNICGYVSESVGMSGILLDIWKCMCMLVGGSGIHEICDAFTECMTC